MESLQVGVVTQIDIRNGLSDAVLCGIDLYCQKLALVVFGQRDGISAGADIAVVLEF